MNSHSFPKSNTPFYFMFWRGLRVRTVEVEVKVFVFPLLGFSRIGVSRFRQ